MTFLGDHPLATAFITLFLVWLARFVIFMVGWRKRMSGLPGPPHNPVFGHLISIGKVATKIPKAIHPHTLPYFLTKEYKLPSVFVLDTYPVATSILVVLNPETGYNVASSDLEKHPVLKEFVKPLAGPENLVVSDGARWKKQRAIFNPGFAVQHLMGRVPLIVDIAEDLVHALDRHAKHKDLFRMEDEATKATVEVIGKVVLDHSFNAFTTENEFSQILKKIISWIPNEQSLNPFHRKHPLRPFFFRYYKRKMDNIIGKVLDERLKLRDANVTKGARSRSIIDLALEAYSKESGNNGDVDSRNTKLDPEFRQSAIDNMLMFLFAGHDTTASTICYCYYLLNKYPEEQAKVREELDTVFGVGVNAANVLREDPYSIGRCEYTAAVVKETLRLYTPASSARLGSKDYFVTDPETGNRFSTEHMMVWSPVSSTHRDPRYWGPDANDFKPSRFMPSNAANLTPNAFRPFEKGHRNCIGQELANIELKVILAMTVREFDVETTFENGDMNGLDGDGSLWDLKKVPRDGVQECYGDEMYQVLMGSAKPREGMPCRVVRREAR